MEKNCVIFVIKNLYSLFLDFIWTWILNFLNILDYPWTEF